MPCEFFYLLKVLISKYSAVYFPTSNIKAAIRTVTIHLKKVIMLDSYMH